MHSQAMRSMACFCSAGCTSMPIGQPSRTTRGTICTYINTEDHLSFTNKGYHIMKYTFDSKHGYRKSKGPSEYYLLEQNITYMKITTAQKGFIKLFPSTDFLSNFDDLNIDGCFLGSVPLGALPSGHHLSNFCQRHAFQGAPTSLGLCIYHSKLKTLYGGFAPL